MLPSISIRLNNLVKALECTIIPAIDPNNDLAQEQATLMISHLSLINEQWDKAFLFEKGTLNRLTAIAGKILSAARGGVETTKVADDIRQSLDKISTSLYLTVEETSQQVDQLGRNIEAMLNAAEADGVTEFIKELENIVLDYSKTQALRERAWFQSAGMDPDRDELPCIDEIL